MRPEHPRKRSKKRFGRFYDRVSGPKTYFSGKFRAPGERRPILGSSAAGRLLRNWRKMLPADFRVDSPGSGTAAGRGLPNGGREGSWLSGLRGMRVQGRRRPASTPQPSAAARHLVGGSLDDPLGWFGRGRSPTSGRAGRATRAAQPRTLRCWGTDAHRRTRAGPVDALLGIAERHGAPSGGVAQRHGGARTAGRSPRPLRGREAASGRHAASTGRSGLGRRHRGGAAVREPPLWCPVSPTQPDTARHGAGASGTPATTTAAPAPQREHGHGAEACLGGVMERRTPRPQRTAPHSGAEPRRAGPRPIWTPSAPPYSAPLPRLGATPAAKFPQSGGQRRSDTLGGAWHHPGSVLMPPGNLGVSDPNSAGGPEGAGPPTPPATPPAPLRAHTAGPAAPPLQRSNVTAPLAGPLRAPSHPTARPTSIRRDPPPPRPLPTSQSWHSGLRRRARRIRARDICSLTFVALAASREDVAQMSRLSRGWFTFRHLGGTREDVAETSVEPRCWVHCLFIEGPCG